MTKYVSFSTQNHISEIGCSPISGTSVGICTERAGRSPSWVLSNIYCSKLAGLSKTSHSQVAAGLIGWSHLPSTPWLISSPARPAESLVQDAISLSAPISPSSSKRYSISMELPLRDSDLLPRIGPHPDHLPAPQPRRQTNGFR